MSTTVSKVYFLSIRKNISLNKKQGKNVNRYEVVVVFCFNQDELNKG